MENEAKRLHPGLNDEDWRMVALILLRGKPKRPTLKLIKGGKSVQYEVNN